MHGTLAQLVEQRTENPCVRSSILRGTTKAPFLGLFCYIYVKLIDMKKIILLLVAIFLISCETAVVEKVETNGEPEGPHTSAEWKIWAYSTAAPSFIAAECTVVDVDGTVLREGTNGWTAMAANPNGGPSDPENGWKDPHEAMPMVGDAAAFAWAQGFMTGTVPKNDVDGWAWMLHGDMGEDNRMYLVTDEEGIAKAKADGQWIESGAHLMLFPADPSTLDGQTTDFNSGAPYVMFAGTEYAHLMIPVEGYYDYQQKK